MLIRCRRLRPACRQRKTRDTTGRNH
jgi:hypothetical protein